MLALTLFSSEGLQTEEEDDTLFHLHTELLFIMCFHISYFISLLQPPCEAVREGYGETDRKTGCDSLCGLPVCHTVSQW